MGAAIVRTAALAGHRVAVVARDRSRLESSTIGIPENQILTLTADVSEWDDMRGAVDATIQRFGRIDVAVANAGVAQSVSFFGKGGVSPDDWDKMVSTNVLGSALTARATLPVLAEHTGQLIFVGSIGGRITRPGLYSPTKWAVTAMAASIRAEAVGSGVRVMVVQPGVIDTESLRGDLKERASLAPETVADTILYAVNQPHGVDINEIVIRPTGQPADC